MTKPIKTSPSKALSILSDNLRLLQERHQWTQVEMGKQAGIPQKQVSRILSKEHEATLSTLSRIAEKLRISEPILLCPGMDARHVPSYSAIREDIQWLIDELIRLEKTGALSEQAVAYLKASIALAVSGNPAASGISESGKSAAQ